jgi:hypothetical protein
MTKLLIVVLALVGLSVPTPAQWIYSIDPEQGTIGTEVTITGDECLAQTKKKPRKIYFRPLSGEEKQYNLKVKAIGPFGISGNSKVTAVITKAKAGVMKLGAIGWEKGKLLASTGVLFDVLPPEITKITSPSSTAELTSAKPGDVVRIRGSNFSTKRGKVLVGAKKAKVVSWTNTTVDIRLPKVANGLWKLEVLNSVGSGLGSITIKGSSAKVPKANLKVSLSNEKPKKWKFVSEVTSAPAELTIRASRKHKKIEHVLELAVPFDPAVGPVPEILSDSSEGTSFVYSQAFKGSEVFWDDPSYGFQFVVGVEGNGRLAGWFTGVMCDAEGACVPITGDFVVDL